MDEYQEIYEDLIYQKHLLRVLIKEAKSKKDAGLLRKRLSVYKRILNDLNVITQKIKIKNLYRLFKN